MFWDRTTRMLSQNCGLMNSSIFLSQSHSFHGLLLVFTLFPYILSSGRILTWSQQFYISTSKSIRQRLRMAIEYRSYIPHICGLLHEYQNWVPGSFVQRLWLMSDPEKKYLESLTGSQSGTASCISGNDGPPLLSKCKSMIGLPEANPALVRTRILCAFATNSSL